MIYLFILPELLPDANLIFIFSHLAFKQDGENMHIRYRVTISLCLWRILPLEDDQSNTMFVAPIVTISHWVIYLAVRQADSA